MIGQSFGEHSNTADFAQKPEQDENNPVENLDRYEPKFPAIAAPAETPLLSETAPAVALPGEPVHYDTPLDKPVTQPVPTGTNVDLSGALLNRVESEQLRARWNEIQSKFVDEPRSAVQQADMLVTDVTEKIIQMFATEHSSLEDQWKQGSDVSTEELRKALQRYRSFFNRLVFESRS